MVVLNGIAAVGIGPETRPDLARLAIDHAEAARGGFDAACHDDGFGEVWYYVSSADQYSRRIEGGLPAGVRRNHIVLWARNAADAAGAAGAPPAGRALGSRAGADGVSIAYGPGADPATATITIGSASIVFDPRTVADVIVWIHEARVGQRHQERFTWDRKARGGAGAFVFAGNVGAGSRPDVHPERDGGVT